MMGIIGEEGQELIEGGVCRYGIILIFASLTRMIVGTVTSDVCDFVDWRLGW